MVSVPGVEVEEGMKFVEYKTSWELNKIPGNIINKADIYTRMAKSKSRIERCYEYLIREVHYRQVKLKMAGKLEPDVNESIEWYKRCLFSELCWYANKRPFYNLYPAAEKLFQDIRFDQMFLSYLFKKCGDVFREGLQQSFDLPCMSINTSSYSCLVTFRYWFSRKELSVVDNDILFYIGSPSQAKEESFFDLCFYSKDGKKPIYSILNRDLRNTSLDDCKLFKPAIICMFLYMTGDTEFAERLLLTKDEKRHPQGEDYERAVERAIRRGKNGWSIGKDWDSIPHFRRPHFGIRWTGKGGKTPKLVPIKGSFVKRSELAKVPTGYLDRK